MIDAVHRRNTLTRALRSASRHCVQNRPSALRPRNHQEWVDECRGGEHDHRASLSSRITCAAVLVVRTGLTSRTHSSHSRMVGLSTLRSSSRLRKSDRLMPSRAARVFRTRCSSSGTSLIRITRHAYSIQTCSAHAPSAWERPRFSEPSYAFGGFEDTFQVFSSK
jgi:hypothetical protein